MASEQDLWDTLQAIIDAATDTDDIDIQEKLFNRNGIMPSEFFRKMRYACVVSLDLCNQIDKAYAPNGKRIEFDGVQRMLRNILERKSL